jgi:hypothetical protein
MASLCKLGKPLEKIYHKLTYGYRRTKLCVFKPDSLSVLNWSPERSRWEALSMKKLKDEMFYHQ